MEKEEFIEKMRSFLIESLLEKDGWKLMKNDIEMYQKIKSLITNSFECTLIIMPAQIKDKVQSVIKKLENFFICEYDEFTSFLKFAQILSTSLLSDLDDKKVHDYAMPHKIINLLDRAIRLNEDNYDELNLPVMGAMLNMSLYQLKITIEKTDWTKGWTDDS